MVSRSEEALSCGTPLLRSLTNLSIFVMAEVNKQSAFVKFFAFCWEYIFPPGAGKCFLFTEVFLAKDRVPVGTRSVAKNRGK